MKFPEYTDPMEPEHFPTLRALSSAFFHKAVLVHKEEPPPPQYVFVPLSGDEYEIRAKQELFMAEWNQCWEWGRHRPEHFRSEMPENLRWLDKHRDLNLRLVPRHTHGGEPSELNGYDPLYALLPLSTLNRFGLPPRKTNWPPGFAWTRDVPSRARERLGQAVAHHLWPLLTSRSTPGDFSRDDPLKVLAHNLDFWLPYVDMVIQRRSRSWGRVEPEDDEQPRQLEEMQAEVDISDAEVRRPCFGGQVWYGQDDAWEAAKEMVELADEHGRLREIIDAILSHRVQEDFSPRWSWVREDFERRLYSKRTKPKVTFVELNDTIPTHGPDVEVEIERSLLWQDLFAVLDAKEKRIIVCLRNGSGTTEISRDLGYANHSPVSKALDSIRKKAAKLLS